MFLSRLRRGGKSSKKSGTLTVGVDVLPPLPKDAGDRNRFEFRAVASNQSIAGPLVAMNTIVADSLDYCATILEKATGGDPKKLNDAVQKLLKEIITKHGKVVFNGDGYSEEWHAEATRRGLPDLKTTVDSLPVLTSKEVVTLFAKYKVLSRRELASRLEVYLEQYCMSISVEANLMVEMGKTIIYPTAMRYQSELAAASANLKAAGVEADLSVLTEVTGLIAKLQSSLAALEAAVAEDDAKAMLAEAKHACDVILLAMLEARQSADALEGLVADDLWPLPTYQEMLFIK